jgi:hypothetical protein
MKPDRIYLFLSMLLLFTVFSWVTSCTHVANIANLPEICFTGEVLPIFVNNCAMTGCHNGGSGRESRMALNNYADIVREITPGNPNSSRLYQAIISKWGNLMPPKQALSLENRTKIRVWIEQGATQTTCPDVTGTTGTPGVKDSTYVARACFTRDILPVIISRCATPLCHDAVSHREGYNYTTYAGIMGSVSPGVPGSSRLYRVITSGGESKMPPANNPPLTAAEIDSIGKWISYGALNENCGEKCDTINPITFSGTIWPIVQSSCLGCHSGTAPSGNVLLASYNNIATLASNGTLISSLKGTGVPQMPVGSTFSACRIRQFEIWIKNGYLNN